jgi:pimeloyl-ACP methyl ester carboxylesterase
MNTPIVLLHSSAASGRQWQALVDVLRPRHEVHAVDFHGHGTQAAWAGPAPMTLADEAAPVERLIERLGGAHVIGHSYGAAVALKLASRRPALVHSLVAYEPVLFGLLLDDAFSRREVQAVVGVAEAMRLRVAQGQPEAAAQRFIDFWSGPGTWASLPVQRQQAFAARVAPTLHHFDALFADPLALADLARLRMPTLLLTGGETVPTARRIVQLVYGALPGARRDTLPSMGHMGPVTHAPLFNRRVVEFLQGLGVRDDRTPSSHSPALLRTYHS